MRDKRWIICAAVRLLVLPCALGASVTLDDEQVVFRLEAPAARSVYLVGDFNNWNPTQDALVSRDGPWETRLFLVPGRYRYLFIVDGKRIPDPDHPHRDQDGYSFFFFRETDGRYELAFAPPTVPEAEKHEVLSAGGRFIATADDDAASFALVTALGGGFEGGLEASAAVAAECRSGRGVEQGGRVFLLRANARRVSGRTFIAAFHRAGELDQGDPLGLFGAVGPFDYPLGLFCRGVAAGAAGPHGLRGRIFHANRLEGYRSGLEQVGAFCGEGGYIPVTDAAGGREDADMLGLSVGGDLGALQLEYLFRRDRGPGNLRWLVPGDPELVATGYRGFQAQGVVVRLSRPGPATLVAQYLAGRSSLTPRARTPDETAPTRFLEPLDWENGYRFALGIDLERGPGSAGLLWRRSMLDGDPLLREGRPEALQDIVEARFEAVRGPLRATARVRGERFADAGQTGRIFWLQSRNFWLDGDRLRTDLLPFLDARGIWELRLECEESRGDTLSGPLRSAGYAAAVMRRGWDGSGRAVFELTAGKGLHLSRALSLHADIRHVAYRGCLPPGRERFLSAWIALRGDLTGGGWIAVGAGVPPFHFDRWRYGFASDGREAYLLDTGLLEAFEQPDSAPLLERLQAAERALERERRIHFEAGFSF